MEACFYSLMGAAEFRDPLLPLWAMELTAKVFLYAWLFALGATVGSFLNVVIYRLPRGMNLAIPGSFCPHCGHAIRLSDNVPILSWLALGGRCRNCGGRISPRYFFVETLVATTFLVVLAGEHYLPAGVVSFATRRVLTPYDGAPFWVMYGLHLVLVVTIYAAVLIAGDGFRVPRRLYWPVLAVALGLPLAWPPIRSVPAFGGWQTGWPAGLVDGIAGLLAGVVIGLAFQAIVRARDRRANEDLPPAESEADYGLVWMMAAVGIVFGWQRVLWIGPLAVLASGWAVTGLRSFARLRAATARPAPDPLTTPDIAATTGALPNTEAIDEEVHIVSPPTEPTEPS